MIILEVNNASSPPIFLLWLQLVD